MTKPTLADIARRAATPRPSRADVPPSRRDRKVFPLYLTPETWRRFKLAAVERDMSMQALAIEALEEKLSR